MCNALKGDLNALSTEDYYNNLWGHCNDSLVGIRQQILYPVVGGGLGNYRLCRTFTVSERSRAKNYPEHIK